MGKEVWIEFMQRYSMGKTDKINQDAWDILNDDEKTAVSLSLGHSKSTWEAGEIMSKAHFKYLEIQKRARKFLEIFTNHLEKYGHLFPEDIFLSFAFKEYLHLTVIERKNISQSVKQMEDSSYGVASRRNKLIIEQVKRLREINSEPAKDLYNLIMDFDRWNNFRILPLEIQEPSAFKRRNKARNVKHLRNITTLPHFSVIKVIEKYSYSGKYHKVYLPLISTYLEEDYKIVPVRKKAGIMKELTDAGLFLFTGRAMAEDFAKLVAGYFLNSVKNCKTGQKFWPEFRVFMAQAYNYKELENIHKSRTYLDHALFDRDKQRVKKRKEKPKPGEDRADDDELFYPKKVK
jgi:hypothetical protein